MVTAPNPVYLGPVAHWSSGNNKPPTRWVIHCTVSPCEVGGARDIAAYFRTQASGGSAHYVSDPSGSVQPAYDGVICWHAPPNPNSIGLELCDPMRGRGKRWHDQDHQQLLEAAAKLTAQGCVFYGIPIKKLDAADLRAGKHGICGHVDVSEAWNQSTHWDPGPAFPWPLFMRMVRHQAAVIRGADRVASPTPQEADKEARKPTRITHVRRVLRHALSKRDGIHDRRAIKRALRDLRGVR